MAWPNAKVTFTRTVNGVTKLVAALFNNPYQVVEDIQDMLGALGCTSQSYSENLKNLLLNFRKGCEVYYSAAAEIKVKVGEIVIPDASGNARWRRNVAEVTVNWDNIDTGSEAAETLYYIYAVADTSATTFTIKISTNATTPTGCTFYKKIGKFYNDVSSNITEVTKITGELLSQWALRLNNTVYLAATDGLVCARNIAGTSYTIQGFTDAATPPTVERATNIGAYCGFTMPVRKGDYWKVTNCSADAVCWIPLGN